MSGPAHLATNSAGWTYLSQHGCDSSVPYSERQLSVAQTLLDPAGWLPWAEIETVLCLASAGGQQAPAFAELGRQVTLFDLSPGQLAVDRQIATDHGYDIEILQGDMLDLSALHGRSFDLVYQPISACYVPDVEALYRQVAKTLRPGGYYRVEHLNSTQVQLDPHQPWDGSAYRIAHAQDTGAAIRLPWWLPGGGGEWQQVPLDHFAHSLDLLIGGLGRTGFDIVEFAERTQGDPAERAGSFGHQCAYLPPYFVTLARKRPRRRSWT